MVLAGLLDDPTNEAAWDELLELAVASSGSDDADRVRALEQGRARFEDRREWVAVTKLLEIELLFASGAAACAMQAELARVLDQELLSATSARAAYERLLTLGPSEEQQELAEEELETDASKSKKWTELVGRYRKEAAEATDDTLRASFLASAAEVALRYDPAARTSEEVRAEVERAVALDARPHRSLVLVDAALAGVPARHAAALLRIAQGEGKAADRVAAGLRAARIARVKLSDVGLAIDALTAARAADGANDETALALAAALREATRWDALLELQQAQLARSVRGAAEARALADVATILSEQRDDASAAEPLFERLRKSEPANPAVLAFYRKRWSGKDDAKRLAALLGEAQKASTDAAQKLALGRELATLAEAGDDAQKAVEQYKALLKADPTNTTARDALKRLYQQSGAWTPLVDVLKQEIERAASSDAKLGALRELAAVHREQTKNEVALVQALTQIVALAESDTEALRDLVRIYEANARFRDLLAAQQKLADALDDASEKAELLRSIGRRWLEQFSNAQNALAAYEQLLTVAPRDPEAVEKLRELYAKRRAWAPLYALLEAEEREADTARKIELLGEMAKLAAERLDRGADAIALQRRILELDPSATAVYDALEKQAEREKDYATLADILDRRAEATADEAQKVALLQKLGAVYTDRLKDADGATRTWRRVLDAQPGNAKALRVLREAFLAAGKLDELEELYASQGDFEALADVLSTSADRATDTSTKVELSFRAASVYEKRLAAPDRATRSYERVLAADGTNLRAAAALVPIYEAEERWVRLPSLYQILLDAASDATERVLLLRKLVKVTGGPLADRAVALGHARRAYELDPSVESLELLEGAARAASSWSAYVEAIEARLGAIAADADARSEVRRLRQRLSVAYARELGKVDEAVAALRALVEDDATDDETVRELDALLRAEGRKDDVRWLFARRIEVASDDAKLALYVAWAELEESTFDDMEAALDLYEKAAARDDVTEAVLRSLARLLRLRARHAEAAVVLERALERADVADRDERELELAALYVDELGRHADALAAVGRVLESQPTNEKARAILERLIEPAPTRHAAAAMLRTAYEAIGEAGRAAEMILVLLEETSDDDVRHQLHLDLVDKLDAALGQPSRAFDAALRALNERPSDVALWEKVDALGASAGRPTDLAEFYRTQLLAPDATSRLPRELVAPAVHRAAKLHDERLGDPDGAVPYLRIALEIDPDDASAFEQLKGILVVGERYADLEKLYLEVVDRALDPAKQIAMLSELATTAEETVGDVAKAVAHHERILGIDALHEPSLDALERLYESEERWPELAKLLEGRLETAVDEEALDLHLFLTELYLDRLEGVDDAYRHVESVLRDKPDESTAREYAERLLTMAPIRRRTALMLEEVFAARDEVRNLVRVLEVQADEENDEESKRSLLRRIGALRDERLHDDAGAFETLSKLVPLVADDLEARERLLDTGRRLGKHEELAGVLARAADAADSPSLRAELRMLVASMFEGPLDDLARAEAEYRKILAIDPDDASIVLPAAKALAGLIRAETSPAALAEALEIQVRHEDDVPARKALFEQLGSLYEDRLSDPARAVTAWRARLEDEPADEPALIALERLFEATGDTKALVEILRRREEVSTNETERRRALEKAAKVLSAPEHDVEEAIAAWRAVLDAFGPDREAHAALAALLERAAKWSDLADVLEAELGLLEEPVDRAKVLVRIGDVRRVRLDDVAGALDAYRQALEFEPTDAAGRAAVEALLDLEEVRRDAAELLLPLYEADGDSERLLKVLDVQIALADLPSERLALLERAAATAEGPLSKPELAYDYAVRALRDAAGDDGFGKQREIVERLTAETGAWEKTVALYRDVVSDVVDGDAQLELYLRIAELAVERLSDPALAIAQYEKAIEARPDDARALVAIDPLYESAGSHALLLGVLKRREELATDDAERKQLFFRQAELLEAKLDDVVGAIEVLEAVLDVELDPQAIGKLEVLYAKTEKYDALVTLFERRIDASPGTEAIAKLRVRIAQVARGALSDLPRAFDELVEALAQDAGCREAIDELSLILSEAKEGEDRARAAELLEPIHLKQGDWNKVKAALEVRLDVSQDPSERADLLRRLATLHEEQLEDYGAALDVMGRLLHEDVADRSVRAELERLARVASAPKRLADIFARELALVTSDDESTAELARRTGELFVEIEDAESALVWFRRALAFEPESLELYDAVERILVEKGRHAERVELMRGALDYRDDEEGAKLLQTIAELEERELDRAEAALDTWRAVLEVDEKNVAALDRLTDLYARFDRPRDLAELYERRAVNSDAPETAEPYRLALARLLRDKLDDTSGAIDQLEAIVGDLPWSRAAIDELEAIAKVAEFKPRVVDILLPLYERSDDWRPLVALNEERVTLATDDLERAGILRDTARLLEERGQDRAAAFKTRLRAFEIDPEDLDARAELERLARVTGAFAELAASYEAVLTRLDDELTKTAMLAVIATIYDEDLGDPRRSMGAWQRLSELTPDDLMALDKIDELAVLLGDWTSAASVLSKKIAIAPDDEAVRLWMRLGQTQAEILEQNDDAIVSYERALELDPERVRAVDRLLALYEEKLESDRSVVSRLVELFARRVELASSDEDELRFELNVRAADFQEGELASPRDAIASLHAALDARPGDVKVLERLERLYRAERMWDELLENLKAQAALATESNARVRIRLAVADLYRVDLDSPAEALEQLRSVLDEEPENDAAIAGLRAIVDGSESLRLEACDALLPVLRRAGRHADRVAVLERRIDALDDAAARVEALQEIASVEELELGRVEPAFNAITRALKESPGDAELHDGAVRLARSHDDAKAALERYATVVQGAIEDALDGELGRALWVRLGELFEGSLDSDDRAAKAYGEAVELAAGDSEQSPLLERLDAVLARLGRTKELSDVIERRAALAADSERASLLVRLAALQNDQFQEPALALGTLRQAIETDPTSTDARAALEALSANEALFEEVAETLESIYRQAGDNSARGLLYERRIGFAKELADKQRLRLDLARMLEDEADDLPGAQRALLAALDAEPSDGDLLSEVERVTRVTGDWAAAAGALEAALDRDTALGASTKGELWLRVAEWRRDHASDPVGAERSFEKVLALDSSNTAVLESIDALQRVPGRERDLVGTLRRRARLAEGAEAVELRKEAKALAASALSDAPLAEEIVREILASDEHDVWALEELTALRREAGDAKETFALLTRRIELEADADRQRALRHEAAKLARGELADRASAIRLYRQVFDDLPTDEAAATALRALYAETGAKAELKELVVRLIDVADSATARAVLRFESAQLAVELGAKPDAIDELQAAIDEDPACRDAVLLLSKLLEEAGRDEDLATLIDRQIEAASASGDRASELAYRLRLGELQETRLGDLETAAATYEAALERDATRDDLLVAIARVHERRGDKAGCAKALERLLDRQQGAEAVATSKKLADLVASLGDDDAQQRALERGLVAGERDVELRSRLRALAERREDWERVAQLVASDARASTDVADQVRLLREAAELQRTKLSAPGAAATLLEEASALVPNDRELLLLLCDVYSESGQGKLAVAALQKIVESFGGRRSKEVAPIYLRMARAYLADGEKTRAFGELDAAFKIDPSSVGVLRELGLLAIALADEATAQGDAAQKDSYLDRAEKTFKALLMQKLEEGSPISKAQVFYHLGDLSFRRGDTKKAIQMLERALDTDKSYEAAKTLLAELKSRPSVV